MAPYDCDRSTDCCRFGVTGREPYPTAVERALLRRAIDARGGPRAILRKNKSLPLADKPCPLLGPDGRCQVYADRPFGCRTFFCERAFHRDGGAAAKDPVLVHRDAVRELGRDIAALSAQAFPTDPHPRPISRVLE
jgi:uncharacterized protein